MVAYNPPTDKKVPEKSREGGDAGHGWSRSGGWGGFLNRVPDVGGSGTTQVSGQSSG